MNLNKDPKSWAHVHPEIVLNGSHAQARNVLTMALADIARLAAEVERSREIILASNRSTLCSNE